ncbi:MAG: OmpA family protein [Sulfurospirillaceae bacterium]|nr:OmpA family protein [Sulfurospirillaceae bacterium]MDD3462720.1 OmpA family protein [Sulfurospirillaceae bacterium]
MKKLLFSMLALTSLVFAGDAKYNYEITPTIGGNVAEGNLDLENQLTYGLRVGRNLDGGIIDQIELGYDRSSGVDYDNSTLDTNINRYYANLVKEYGITPEMAIYGLVGMGYEDLTDNQYENRDSFFAQYGAGIKYWVSDMFALKAELRHAVKFRGGDNNMFYTLGFVIPLGAKAQPAPAVKEEPKPEPVAAPAPVIEEPKPAAKPMPKDSDGDGVYDDADKCPDTPKGVVVDENGCPKVIRLHVKFDFDKAVIPDSYMKEIKRVSEFMAQNPAYSVVLEGHTDSQGSDKYNQKLSEKRANAVSKALVGLGVATSKISVEAYGESKPIATNDTKAGRAENRRVDARFNY